MELKEALTIVISGLAGACGFALLFRVRKSKILWATLGGGLVCVVYVVCLKHFRHEFFQNLFPALFGAGDGVCRGAFPEVAPVARPEAPIARYWQSF